MGGKPAMRDKDARVKRNGSGADVDEERRTERRNGGEGRMKRTKALVLQQIYTSRMRPARPDTSD